MTVLDRSLENVLLEVVMATVSGKVASEWREKLQISFGVSLMPMLLPISVSHLSLLCENVLISLVQLISSSSALSTVKMLVLL